MNLSPEEIEEFSQAMKAADNTGRRAKQVRPYDFAHPDKLSKVHIRVLQSMMSCLERIWPSTLTSSLKAETVVTLDSVEQASFGACLESFPAESVITAMTMKPLSGTSYLQMPSSFALGLVGRMAGSRGQSKWDPRELTIIEQKILHRLLDKLTADLKTAWKPLIGLDVAVSKIHNSPEEIELLPEDMMLVVGFTWTIGPVENKVAVVMPTSSLDLVRDLLTPEQWLRGKPSEDQIQAAATPSALLVDVPVQAAVELGRAQVSMQDIIGIDIGDVIRLNRSVDDLLEIKIQGETKFQGRPGLVGSQLAVQITEQIQEKGAEIEQEPAGLPDAPTEQ